jgi:putative acetyltransferase
MEIRKEERRDFAGVRAVHEAAFPTSTEADLVDALRDTDAWRDDLSIVAVQDGEVVGHLLISVAHLDTGAPILALAPMAVQPARQRQGIGGALVRASLERAAQTGLPLVVVLGHPGYYPKFGFGSASALGIRAPFDVPDEAWMAMRLPGWGPEVAGTVVYPPAFDAV